MREKHWLVACSTPPDWGPNPQARYVPWLGIEPATFWCTGWYSNQLNHPPGQGWKEYLMQIGYLWSNTTFMQGALACGRDAHCPGQGATSLLRCPANTLTPASFPRSMATMGKCNAGLPKDSTPLPLHYPSSGHMTACKKQVNSANLL